MLREMTWLAQVHIAVKWQSHDLNQFHQFLMFMFLTVMLKEREKMELKFENMP